jgi:hypothetical protein
MWQKMYWQTILCPPYGSFNEWWCSAKPAPEIDIWHAIGKMLGYRLQILAKFWSEFVFHTWFWHFWPWMFRLRFRRYPPVFHWRTFTHQPIFQSPHCEACLGLSERPINCFWAFASQRKANIKVVKVGLSFETALPELWASFRVLTNFRPMSDWSCNRNLQPARLGPFHQNLGKADAVWTMSSILGCKLRRNFDRSSSRN